MLKPPGRPNLALADFVAPRETGVADYVGALRRHAGHGLDDAGRGSSRREHDDYSAILAKALADRLAEAFAERLHERVRREYWGYAPDEALRQRRPRPRAVPGHPAGAGISRLPRPHREARPCSTCCARRRNAGITLTESFAMLPTAAVSGYYFWHPQAQYFGVGKIERDQVEDYARRKGMDVATAERWLAPNLNYER